jgi:hypothetical protein
MLADCAFETSIDVLLKHFPAVSLPVLHGRFNAPC